MLPCNGLCFRAFQNLVSEHSSEGAPASLYNLTKSAPDPLAFHTISSSFVIIGGMPFFHEPFLTRIGINNNQESNLYNHKTKGHALH